MKAAQIRATGGPEVLQIVDVDQPQPGEGEVLVKVHAASVNPLDYKIRRGDREVPLPAILGIDVSGVVEASNGSQFAEGDEVFGIAASGSYAEYTTASSGMLAAKPSGISHEQAAAIPVAGNTAWQALFETGGLQDDQTALIAGASGGVGHFAVQFSHNAGARVIGSASGRNREFVESLGADEFVDYTEQDVGETVSGADVVFDTVGGSTTAGLVPALAEGGVLVTIAGEPPSDAAEQRGASAELLIGSPNPEILARIADQVASGEVRIEISETLPLDEIRRAHELSESGRARGKIVIAVGA
jgi:NADPH:quinone reductase-like Zn-dependent oxidoreductase